MLLTIPVTLMSLFPATAMAGAKVSAGAFRSNMAITAFIIQAAKIVAAALIFQQISFAD